MTLAYHWAKNSGATWDARDLAEELDARCELFAARWTPRYLTARRRDGALQLVLGRFGTGGRARPQDLGGAWSVVVPQVRRLGMDEILRDGGAESVERRGDFWHAAVHERGLARLLHRLSRVDADGVPLRPMRGPAAPPLSRQAARRRAARAVGVPAVQAAPAAKPPRPRPPSPDRLDPPEAVALLPVTGPAVLEAQVAAMLGSRWQRAGVHDGRPAIAFEPGRPLPFAIVAVPVDSVAAWQVRAPVAQVGERFPARARAAGATAVTKVGDQYVALVTEARICGVARAAARCAFDLAGGAS